MASASVLLCTSAFCLIPRTRPATARIAPWSVTAAWMFALAIHTAHEWHAIDSVGTGLSPLSPSVHVEKGVAYAIAISMTTLALAPRKPPQWRPLLLSTAAGIAERVSTAAALILHNCRHHDGSGRSAVEHLSSALASVALFPALALATVFVMRPSWVVDSATLSRRRGFWARALDMSPPAWVIKHTIVAFTAVSLGFFCAAVLLESFLPASVSLAVLFAHGDARFALILTLSFAQTLLGPT